MTTTNKGFIKDLQGNTLLPITRGELVLDKDGNIALTSKHFLAGGDNDYGLVTAAERAMLTGTGSNGGSLSDLYTKLQYINEGLTIGEKTYSFYDENGDATPISIIGTLNLIAIATNVNNNILLSLSKIHEDDIAIKSGVVKGIEVDEYGRVTSVTAVALTNDDIPGELSGKVLTGCTTTDVDKDDSNAIVNKGYVDSKFNEANTVATGALKFGGTIADLDKVEGIILNELKYHYYKVIETLKIPADYSADSNDINVKAGDTLIVDGNNKLVYVPSGDDITLLTIQKTASDGAITSVINQQLGSLILKFSPIFSIENFSGNNTANITIPPVSDKNDGYLTSEDYNKFLSYSTNLSTSFTSSILDTAAGVYQIGKLKVGTAEYPINGLKNSYRFNLIDETVVDEKPSKLDPTIQLSENGTVVSSISYKGNNGIIVTKNDNTLNISLKENVSTDSNYLLIGTGDRNNEFTIKLGEIGENNTIEEGLTSFSQFIGFVLKVMLQIETIEETLIPQEGGDNETKYRYGNLKLKNAITLAVI